MKNGMHEHACISLAPPQKGYPSERQTHIRTDSILPNLQLQSEGSTVRNRGEQRDADVRLHLSRHANACHSKQQTARQTSVYSANFR